MGKEFFSFYTSPSDFKVPFYLQVSSLEEDVRLRERTISQLKSAQTNMESSAAMINSLEESITEKEKQIERSE